MQRSGSVSIPLLIGCAVLAASAAVSGAADNADMPAASANWAAPTWTAAAALVLARSSASQSLAAEFRHTLRTAPNTLSARLQAMTEQDDLPWPVREAALLRLVDDLGDLRRDQVPASVMSLLIHWQPRTLVAHEEMPSLGASLFPIAARAQGLENRWQREASAQLGAELLTSAHHGHGAEAFLAQWSSATDPAARAGLLDALAVTRTESVRAVLMQAQHDATALPDLAIVARQAALVLKDMGAMADLIHQGSASGLRATLQTLADTLDRDALTALLAKLERAGDRPRLGLAIGVWSQELSGYPPAEALLLDLLDDQEVGSSAALALAHAPSADALAKLHRRAAAPDVSNGAKRARLALQMDQTAEMPQ